MTLWPETAVPLEGAGRAIASYELDDHVLRPVGWPNDPRHPWEPSRPDETYLELAALDADDPAAVLAFANAHGVLGIRWDNFRSVPTQLSADAQALLDQAHAEIGAGTMHGYATYPQGFGVPVPNEETLGEFRFAAWATRSMAEAWHAFQHAESDRAAYDAGVLIEQWLSAALWPFGPTVDLVDAAHDRPILAPYVSLYSICALQLFNHMARGEVWRQCANETCSQLFVHQAGRAEFRQHRLHGVKFHSAACAQAQAQREYRRRKKERR